MGDEEKKLSLGFDAAIGAKYTPNLSLPVGLPAIKSTPAAAVGHVLVGPTYNFSSEGRKPFKATLMGGLGFDSSNGNATKDLSVDKMLHWRETNGNPSDSSNQEVIKATQLKNDTKQFMGRLNISYNQEGWMGSGLNGNIYATGTSSLNLNSGSMPPINTVTVGGSIGNNFKLGHRRCFDDAKYLNIGVNAERTIYNNFEYNPNATKGTITPFIGMTRAIPTTAGDLNLYVKAGMPIQGPNKIGASLTCGIKL